MNPTVRAAIDAELATLTRVVYPPEAAQGYGSDLSCIYDSDERMTTVDYNSPVAIVQAIIRRLITDRGQLPDDPDYGTNVRKYLHKPLTRRQIVAVENDIRAEALKDERVQNAAVEASYAFSTRTLTCSMVITPFGSAQSFRFVFTVTSAQVLLDTIEVGNG